MALNTRSTIDPRWPFAHRQVVRGTMLCMGVLLRPAPLAVGVVDWAPDAIDPTPGASGTHTEIYRGPARVQPGQDWRAREQNNRSEIAVEHAIRIQLDFAANELDGGVLPDVQVGDVFRVTDVLTLDGVEVDPQLRKLVYIVRNHTPGSNAWVRNITADADMSKVVEPYG